MPVVITKECDYMSLTVNNKNTNISALFGSLNNNNSSNGISGMGSLLSEYASIKNGSYAKLAKQYYAKNSDKKSSLNKDVYGNLSDDTKFDINSNKGVMSDAGGVRTALSGLSSDDALFTNKIKVKDENGNETESLDYDKIYSKVSSFVKGYNSLIESASESDDDTVLRNTLNITNATDRNRTNLKNAGITVNADNTLSVDKDSIKNADIDALKSLFGSKSSYGKTVDTLATNVASKSAQNIYSLGGYNSAGAYKQALEGIYNTTV